MAARLDLADMVGDGATYLLDKITIFKPNCGSFVKLLSLAGGGGERWELGTPKSKQKTEAQTDVK